MAYKSVFTLREELSMGEVPSNLIWLLNDMDKVIGRPFKIYRPGMTTGSTVHELKAKKRGNFSVSGIFGTSILEWKVPAREVVVVHDIDRDLYVLHAPSSEETVIIYPRP